MLHDQGTLGDVIGPPHIQLVNLDGSPAGVPARPPVATAWPAWVDILRFHVGASDSELDDHRLSVGIGSALTRTIWTAENARVEPDDFDVAMDALEAENPIPDPLVESFKVPEEWNDEPIPADAVLTPPELEPDASWWSDGDYAVPGRPPGLEPPDAGYGAAPDENWTRNRSPLALAAAGVPLAGGSPEDPGPTAADRVDFESWLASVDSPYPPVDQVAEMRRWYDLHPLAEFNAIRPD